MWTEDGVELDAGRLLDAGDLALPDDAAEAGTTIESAVRELLGRGHPLICLGGDHSITYPIVRAFHGRFRDVTILHFDAHPDLYDELGGRLSHACQFSRIMEAQFARRLVQVGIRTMNGSQLAQARRFGVDVVSMRHIERLRQLTLDGPVYISFDLDVLDPAFAPGVSHHEPGGLSVREALTVIQQLRVPVLGADIVEYNPTRDVHARTAMAAAKVLKEIAAAMLRGTGDAEEWV